MHVTGSNFTPGGTVLVEVLSLQLNVLGSTTTTATPSGGCTPYVCFLGGNIDTSLYLPWVDWIPTVYVVAYDYGSGTWSSWIKA